MAGGSPSMPAYRPKRKKSSTRSQGSPSMPSQRPAARQRQERVATRNYRPPSSATRQGSPSQPAARPQQRKALERKATKTYARREKVERGRKVAKAKREIADKESALRTYLTLREDLGWAGKDGKTKLAGLRGRDLYSQMGAVEKANFAGNYDRLWEKASGHYPKGATKPKLEFSDSKPGIAGFVMKNDRDTVHITPSSYFGANLRPSSKEARERSKLLHPKAFGGRSDKEQKGRENFYRTGVPAHEWAHSFQKGNERKSKAEVEGGAELLAREVAKSLGQPFKTPSRKYRRYAKAVGGRSDAKAYVRKGQFKGR